MPHRSVRTMVARSRGPRPRPLRVGARRAALLPAVALSLAASLPPRGVGAQSKAPDVWPPAPSGGAADSLSPVTLENGLQIFVVENHSVPLATAQLVVRTGAMAQPDDEQGVPHLFEHMLFKSYRGAGGRPFAYEAAALQAAYNGTTAEELVTYYLTLPSGGVDRAVRLLAGLARDARFTDADLRTERFVVLGELQRGNSEPHDVLRRAVGELLWGAGWPRKNTIGATAALLGVGPKRLTEIYRHYYVPNNAALVVTGDVSTAEVLEAARRHFGPWARRPDPFAAHPVAPMPALDSSRAVVLTGDVGSVTVLMQWQGPSVRRDASATYDADVLSDVVNDEESEFTRRLVHEGRFETARLSYQTLAHTGPITFFGTTTMEQLAAALSALQGELFMMRSPQYFDARALATAAKRRRVAQSFQREEGVTLAHALGYAWAVTGLPYHATYADSLAARRPADLTRFVGRYIAGRPFVIGVLAPPGRDGEVAQMLEQFVEFSREGP